MRPFLLLAALLAGCDDTIFYPPAHGRPVDIGDGGWCGVRAVLASSCGGCHSAAGAAGGLDLETDPHAALVDGGLVVPGDPDASLLLAKLDGTAAGGAMPPSGMLDSAVRDAFRDWVAAGADADCSDAPPPIGGVGPHPAGWAAPDQHGMAAKFQQLDCRQCHSDTLTGDVGPACTSCHTEGWLSDCTSCHGGVDSPSGAPPQDIDDNDDLAYSPFRPHTAHLAPGAHAPIACETCHRVPSSALAEGHVFADGTPGRAEVVFTGLATGGAWNGQQCTVACHGNGRGPGTVDHQAGPRQCDSCHPFLTSSEAALESMSGEHRDHVDEGILCSACHAGTVDSTGTIVGPAQHVDGTVQLQLPAGMTRSGGTCTGTCHGEVHAANSWL